MTKYIIEIKNRLFLIFLGCTIFTLVSYYYRSPLLILSVFLNSELINKNLLNYFIFTSITDLFLTYIKLSVSFLSYFLYYMLCYQTICFLQPGLYHKEFRYLKKLFNLSFFFGLMSATVTHKILLPFTSSFFLGYYLNNIQYMDFYFEANICEYFVFYKKILFSSFLNFQVLVVFSFTLNLLSYNKLFLKRSRKFIFLVLLILSTISTPPDILSQILSYVCLIFSFEISVFFERFRTKISQAMS